MSVVGCQTEQIYTRMRELMWYSNYTVSSVCMNLHRWLEDSIAIAISYLIFTGLGFGVLYMV